MILIFSTPRDLDTQFVIDYLKVKKVDFFRLNDEDIMTGKTFLNIVPENLEESYIFQDSSRIYFKNINIVWYRKFGFLETYKEIFGKRSDLSNYVKNEFWSIASLIKELLKDKKWLFKRDNMLSKIEILDLAKKHNLQIPNTLITSNKEDLKSFFLKNNKKIISKSIGDGRIIQYENYSYSFYTQMITSLENVSYKFSPSLFQGYIHKEYELRVIYLEGKFYSMVIFSQKNEKTKYDFRNYDWDNPNRVGRYSLPQSIEDNLSNLMDDIGLNTGSIDLIKSTDGHYYFLEVNPSGQMGMTTFPCNYMIHEKIADYLIKNNNYE